MAGKPIRMSKIKQLLRLRCEQPELSLQVLGSIVGMDRGTISGYFRKIKGNGDNIADLLLLDDLTLEKKLLGGNPAYLDKKFLEFKALIPHFESELKRKHVTRRLLWEEYRLSCPDGYGYSQFCFHLSQLKVARKDSSAILVHEPGKELYVDFAGDKLSYIEQSTGEVVTVEVFVAVLPYSNYTFVLAVPSQSTEDFIYAMNKCLRYLGGTPAILVPDNLKAAVIKTNRYEPTLNRVLEDLANHYSVVVIPARPKKPRDKSNVENGVHVTYTRIYAKIRNLTFFNLTDLNAAIADKLTQYNQTRMQRLPYSREEKFLAEEKQLLKPLPPDDFEVQSYAQLTVTPNNCVYLSREQHNYSVPYQYIGIKVDLVITRALIKIYTNGEQIAVHPREKGPGYTTKKEHFSSAHQHYSKRSSDYYIGLAAKRSPGLEALITRILQIEVIPELAYKTCDGLLSLQRKTDPIVFEQACVLALDNDLLGYKKIQNIIKKCAAEKEENGASPRLPFHENVRGRNNYK